MQIISKADIHSILDWRGAIQAIAEGHRGDLPQVQDILLQEGEFNLFNRCVILPGFGAGVKVASIYPPNINSSPPRPVEDAAFLVIDEQSKAIKAVLDGPEITRWKTAADSALASKILSRKDNKILLIIGAGPISQALAEAHFSVRPGIERILLWNRTVARAESSKQYLAKLKIPIEIVLDLDHAVARANIISSATGSETPLIKGELVQPGTHVDLVGSFQCNMREADDTLMQRGQIYVDYRETTVEQSGDLSQPISNGAITTGHIRKDLFELVKTSPFIRDDDDITIFKNKQALAALAINMQDSGITGRVHQLDYIDYRQVFKITGKRHLHYLGLNFTDSNHR